MRSACASLLLVAALGGRATAQRGSLTATLTGHRKASDTLALRIAVQMTPGWHIGAPRPGASGLPTELTWRLPPGWRVVASRWPTPASTPSLGGRDTVFEYRGPFAIETTLVADGRPRSGTIEALVVYGLCRDVCIPGRLTLTYAVR